MAMLLPSISPQAPAKASTLKRKPSAVTESKGKVVICFPTISLILYTCTLLWVALLLPCVYLWCIQNKGKSDSSSEDDSSDESDEEPQTKKIKASTVESVKKAKVDSSSDESSDEEPPKKMQPKKEESSSDESSDDSSDEEPQLKYKPERLQAALILLLMNLTRKSL